LSGCARIPNAAQRVACYDRLAGVSSLSTQAVAAVPAGGAIRAGGQSALDLSNSDLAQRGRQAGKKLGTFSLGDGGAGFGFALGRREVCVVGCQRC
jgi:hypothetical protein